MLEQTTVTCPYCGEPIDIMVDCSAGDQHYTEDCTVCCQPVELMISMGPDGTVAHIEAAVENR